MAQCDRPNAAQPIRPHKRKSCDQALQVEVRGFEPLTSSVREKNRPIP
jgi:hypothetical protein